MSRVRLFDAGAAPIRGLECLTQPAASEDVAAVVDVAVLGARADGKTQFIAHAIRTLRAFAPTGLSARESDHNQDILQVVMNARDPRPDATAPGYVKHFTFRARPDSLLRALGTWARWRALWARASFRVLVGIALLNASLLLGLAFRLHGEIGPIDGALAGGAALIGLVLAYRVGLALFARSGDIEIVFWDVAGEEVYGKSASGYYTFLATLAQTRQVTQPKGRLYGFAPVLICNPLAVAVDDGNSAFARLRLLMPLFAALSRPAAEVLVAVNRWALVQHICQLGKRGAERVAVLPVALEGKSETESDGTGEQAETSSAAAEALPVLRRRVVRDQCVDVEDADLGDTAVRCIHYDAGLHAELADDDVTSFDKLPAEARKRFAEPDSSFDSLITYRYAEGPSSFEGEARQEFVSWLLATVRSTQAKPAQAEGERERARPKRSTSELFVLPSEEDEDGAGFSSGGT